MNKIVASISLGTAVCITASAFAQDSHLSLTRQSVASMHEIAAALDKVTDEPGAAAAVETVKKVHKKLLDIGKRQLELPGATLQEQAQVSAQMTEAQKISGELIKSLSRLKKEGLLTPDLQKALADLQSVQKELAQASRDKAEQAEPFQEDAEGNTHETLLTKTVEEVKKLNDSLARVRDEETGKAAVEQIGRYRAAMLDPGTSPPAPSHPQPAGQADGSAAAACGNDAAHCQACNGHHAFSGCFQEPEGSSEFPFRTA